MQTKPFLQAAPNSGAGIVQLCELQLSRRAAIEATADDWRCVGAGLARHAAAF